MITFLPYLLGVNNLLLTMYMFKMLVAISYVALCRIIWLMTRRNTYALVFFGLNPVVITESLISAHNDVIMMLLALAAFGFLKKNHALVGLLILLFSGLIKFATLVLLPIYVYVMWHQKKSKKIDWISVWRWAAILMMGMFFITPLREELYPWYFIWPLTFITLLPRTQFMHVLSYGFTLGLPLRFAPFIYAGEWGRWVPTVKTSVSLIPPAITSFWYGIKKKI